MKKTASLPWQQASSSSVPFYDYVSSTHPKIRMSFIFFETRLIRICNSLSSTISRRCGRTTYAMVISLMQILSSKTCQFFAVFRQQNHDLGAFVLLLAVLTLANGGHGQNMAADLPLYWGWFTNQVLETILVLDYHYSKSTGFCVAHKFSADRASLTRNHQIGLVSIGLRSFRNN